MNPVTLGEALELGKACDKEGVVLCAPFPYLAALKQVLRHAKLGAQNCCWEQQGAYTGEVSSTMLKDLGCEFVIIGHSERRKYGKEDNTVIRKKLAACAHAGLATILCIRNLHDLDATESPFIAYEPEQAISSNGGKVADSAEIASVVAHIRSLAAHAILLYGGSVHAANTQEILALPLVDGVLVGKASLEVDEFLKIVAYA